MFKPVGLRTDHCLHCWVMSPSPPPFPLITRPSTPFQGCSGGGLVPAGLTRKGPASPHGRTSHPPSPRPSIPSPLSQAALEEDWSLLGSREKGLPGLMGARPTLAFTFIDNHDTAPPQV